MDITMDRSTSNSFVTQFPILKPILFALFVLETFLFIFMSLYLIITGTPLSTVITTLLSCILFMAIEVLVLFCLLDIVQQHIPLLDRTSNGTNPLTNLKRILFALFVFKSVVLLVDLLLDAFDQISNANYTLDLSFVYWRIVDILSVAFQLVVVGREHFLLVAIWMVFYVIVGIGAVLNIIVIAIPSTVAPHYGHIVLRVSASILDLIIAGLMVIFFVNLGTTNLPTQFDTIGALQMTQPTNTHPTNALTTNGQEVNHAQVQSMSNNL